MQWFNYQGRSYEVIPQVYRKYRMNPDQARFMYLRAASGQLVPLTSITTITTSRSPNTLNQFAQQRYQAKWHPVIPSVKS